MLILCRSLALMRCQALSTLLLQRLSNLLTQLSCHSWSFWPNQITRFWLRHSLNLGETPFCNRLRSQWDLEVKDKGAIVLLVEVVSPARGVTLTLLHLVCEQKSATAEYSTRTSGMYWPRVDQSTWWVECKPSPSSLGSLGSRGQISFLFINRQE